MKSLAYIRVRVPSGVLRFLIDTGAPSSLLNRESIANKSLIINSFRSIQNRIDTRIFTRRKFRIK